MASVGRQRWGGVPDPSSASGPSRQELIGFLPLLPVRCSRPQTASPSPHAPHAPAVAPSVSPVGAGAPFWAGAPWAGPWQPMHTYEPILYRVASEGETSERHRPAHPHDAWPARGARPAHDARSVAAPRPEPFLALHTAAERPEPLLAPRAAAGHDFGRDGDGRLLPAPPPPPLEWLLAMDGGHETRQVRVAPQANSRYGALAPDAAWDGSERGDNDETPYSDMLGLYGEMGQEEEDQFWADTDEAGSDDLIGSDDEATWELSFEGGSHLPMFHFPHVRVLLEERVIEAFQRGGPDEAARVIDVHTQDSPPAPQGEGDEPRLSRAGTLRQLFVSAAGTDSFSPESIQEVVDQQLEIEVEIMRSTLQIVVEKRNQVQEFLRNLSVERLNRNLSGTCAVCQDRMLRGHEMRRLPCSHTFHRECIDAWLLAPHATRSPRCPVDNLPLPGLGCEEHEAGSADDTWED